MQKFRGLAKTELANCSQPFQGQSSPNLGACRGVPVDWQVLSNCWYHVLLHRYVQSNFKVGLKKAFFAHQLVEVNAWGSSDQIFQIAVIIEYVSKFACHPFSDLRDSASKKEEERKNQMHSKAQREPARHSVVLDCQLVPQQNTCQSLPAVCYNIITSM